MYFFSYSMQQSTHLATESKTTKKKWTLDTKKKEAEEVPKVVTKCFYPMDDVKKQITTQTILDTTLKLLTKMQLLINSLTKYFFCKIFLQYLLFIRSHLFVYVYTRTLNNILVGFILIYGPKKKKYETHTKVANYEGNQKSFLLNNDYFNHVLSKSTHANIYNRDLKSCIHQILTGRFPVSAFF